MWPVPLISCSRESVLSGFAVVCLPQKLRAERDELRTKHRAGLKAYHENFHPVRALPLHRALRGRQPLVWEWVAPQC